MPKCPDNTNCPANTRCVQTGYNKFECRGSGSGSGTPITPVPSIFGRGRVGGGPSGTGGGSVTLRPPVKGSGSIGAGPSGSGTGIPNKRGGKVDIPFLGPIEVPSFLGDNWMLIAGGVAVAALVIIMIMR